MEPYLPRLWSNIASVIALKASWRRLSSRFLAQR